MKRTAHLLLIALLLAACGGWRGGDRLLKEAERIIENYPDSALRLLESLIEEEDQVTMQSFWVNEPYLAHVYARNIYEYGDAWIDITATNQYGSDTKTVELLAGDEGIGSRIANRHYDEGNVLVDIISGSTGRVICNDVRAHDMPRQNLPMGVYLLKYKKGNHIWKTKKLIVK